MGSGAVKRETGTDERSGVRVGVLGYYRRTMARDLAPPRNAPARSSPNEMC